jgi:hypothetical protein
MNLSAPPNQSHAHAQNVGCEEIHARSVPDYKATHPNQVRKFLASSERFKAARLHSRGKPNSPITQPRLQTPTPAPSTPTTHKWEGGRGISMQHTPFLGPMWGHNGGSGVPCTSQRLKGTNICPPACFCTARLVRPLHLTLLLNSTKKQKYTVITSACLLLQPFTPAVGQ